MHSPATNSKCGVPPLITAPRAMIASVSLLTATRFAASGISKAPGTFIIVIFNLSWIIIKTKSIKI